MADNGKVSEQLSKTDIDLLQAIYENKNELNSDDLSDIINKLYHIMRIQEQKKAERKRQEEQKCREREAKEAEEKRQAHIKKVTSMDLSLDWENVFSGDTRMAGIHADSAADGLILSLSTLGRVDIEYISAIIDMDYKTVICALKGSIYQNPEAWGECFYKGWETAEEYLSENLMRKRKAAEIASKAYDGYFSDNIKAIDKVLPPTVAAKDIYITLDSPWVPADVGRILRTFKVKKNVEITDNGKIII